MLKLIMFLVPVDPSVSSQLVDPRSVYKHYNPYDLVSLAQQVSSLSCLKSA